jgi:hypothetical protein
MRKFAILIVLLATAWPAKAAQNISVGQMEQLLLTLRGQPEKKVAHALEDVDLSERASLARLTQWEAEFPGERTREELMRLADESAFMDPPAEDVVQDPAPDTEAQQHILQLAVEYVKSTATRLPNLYATRETTHFQNPFSPPAGSSMAGITGTASLASASDPGDLTMRSESLYRQGRYAATVSYRDGHELLEGKKTPPSLGLITDGEFGTFLEVVLGDALHGKLLWLRWEQRADKPEAVFQYAATETPSKFMVQVANGDNIQTIFPAYHGEIEIDPATGAILRLSQVADMPPSLQAMRASILVDYGPVTLGQQEYICPMRGVAYSERPLPVRSVKPLSAPPIPLRQLNDITFTDYHLFRAEARIVGDVGASPQ